MTVRERMTAPPDSMELVPGDADLGAPLWTVDADQKDQPPR